MRKNIWKITSISGIIMGYMTGYGYAETVPNYELNPYTVTAQRTKLTDIDTPSATTIISEKELKQTGATDLFDALSFVTGITNFSYGPGGMDYGAMDSRINVRGMDKGTLVLINGAPVNLNGKASVSGISLSDVESVEIVRGASSVLYGAEAMSGVINIKTKSAGTSKDHVSVFGGNTDKKGYEMTVSSDRARITVGKIFTGKISQTSPVRWDRKYYNSLGKSDVLHMSANIQINDFLNFNYMRSESNNAYSQQSIIEDPVLRRQSTPTYRYHDTRNNATLTYERDTFRAILFYNDRLLYGQTQKYDKKKNPYYYFFDNTSNYKGRKIGTDVQNTWHFRDGKDTLIVGVLTSRDEYEGTSEANRDVTAGRNTYAGYGSYQYQITPKWSTIIGARYQYVNDPVKDQHIFIPQWQMLYKLSDNTSMYTNVGKSFTMPNLSDSMAKNNSGKYINVSGQNLKPEEGWNYEVGVKKLFFKSSLKVDIFHMDFNNLFAWAPDENGKNTIRVNGGKFKNTGVEIEYKQKINQAWTWGIGISYSNPQVQNFDSGEWTLSYPKFQFNGFIAYVLNKWSAGTSVNWLTKRLTNRDGDRNPDLIRWNAYLNYDVNNDSSIRLNIENILDRHNVITNGNYEYWDYPRNYQITYIQKF